MFLASRRERTFRVRWKRRVSPIQDIAIVLLGKKQKKKEPDDFETSSMHIRTKKKKSVQPGVQTPRVSNSRAKEDACFEVPGDTSRNAKERKMQRMRSRIKSISAIRVSRWSFSRYFASIIEISVLHTELRVRARASAHASPEIDPTDTKGHTPSLHVSAAPFLVTVPRNLTRGYDCGAWRPSIFVRGRFTVYARHWCARAF